MLNYGGGPYGRRLYGRSFYTAVDLGELSATAESGASAALLRLEAVPPFFSVSVSESSVSLSAVLVLDFASSSETSSSVVVGISVTVAFGPALSYTDAYTNLTLIYDMDFSAVSESLSSLPLSYIASVVLPASSETKADMLLGYRWATRPVIDPFWQVKPDIAGTWTQQTPQPQPWVED